MNWTFISEYADGSATNSYPDPLLGEQNHRVFDMYSPESLLEFVDQSIGFYKVNEIDVEGWQTLFGIVLWAISMAINNGHF